MEQKSTIRFYRPGDEEAINDLFNQVFHRARTLEHWRWKYLDSPVACAEVIPIAEVDGKIVGAYPGMVLRFKVVDGMVLATQVVDLCILPGYGHGWTQMAMFHSYGERMRAMQVGFGFGFPNEVAYKVSTRLLGNRELCQMPILRKRLNFRLAVRRRLASQRLERVAAWLSHRGYRLWHGFRGYRSPGGVQIETVDEFDDTFDTFWEQISGRYPILAVRDRAYLQWRYGQNPHGRFLVLRAWRHGAMAGYLIAKVVESAWGERSSVIFDFLTVEDRGVALALLRQGIAAALEAQVDNLKIGVLRHHPCWDILREEGFQDRSESLPVVYALYDPSLDDRGIAQASRWFLTLGDTDFLG